MQKNNKSCVNGGPNQCNLPKYAKDYYQITKYLLKYAYNFSILVLLAYLICVRILYASVSCMTNIDIRPYLISERILYASVSYKRASTVHFEEKYSLIWFFLQYLFGGKIDQM